MEMVAQRLDILSGRKLNQQLSKCSEVAGHYLHELRKQIQFHKLYVVMILKKLQMAYIDLTQLDKVHTKASSKIKRLGRSVSQRRMPRETEKPPLTMIDEKPTDYFFLTEFSRQRFLGFRTHVVATAVCTTGVYIHSLVARTFLCCTVCLRIFAHFSCVSHTRMAQVHDKGSLHM